MGEGGAQGPGNSQLERRAEEDTSKSPAKTDCADGPQVLGTSLEKLLVTKVSAHIDNLVALDVGMLEGTYKSMHELQARVSLYDAMYAQPVEGTTAGTAFDAIHKKYPQIVTERKPLAEYFCVIHKDMIREGLDAAGIIHFRTNIIAREDGIYAIGYAGKPAAKTETKIAEISKQ